ncbi:hypothetical protein ETD83_08530 [Actinomadura soli]|uniref:Uncharacterized protein n=1 Tax=Actinomadura soli TaxID=2508997 RepID=A0A5C4JGQ3_9ACTN|nr:hypothetical protein [Actinomadura soli]TMR04303.1 hypothetical protein ETD83_08530 [Actinomadura soli]
MSGSPWPQRLAPLAALSIQQVKETDDAFLLPWAGRPWTGPATRAAGGTLLYLALIALFSLGLAAALRDTATALSTVLALLYMPGILTRFIADERWNTLVDRYAPMSAGLAVQSTAGPSAQSIGPWAGLGVLAAYATAAMAAVGAD